MAVELTISRLGAQGDGIAETEGGPVYVPFALPGERILAELEQGRAISAQRLSASPERVDPICPHFGICGGCALQHLELSRYRDWKRQGLVDALSRERIDVPVEPLRIFGPHTRRRAVFTASRSGGVTSFGFRRAQSHDVVDLRVCPVLLPRFEAAIPALRELAGALLHSGEARVGVTACDNGFDVAIDAGKSGLRPFTPALGSLAGRAGIIRLTAGRDPLFSLGGPVIRFSGVEVELPPGAFLQAAAEAEAAMAGLAVEAFGKARKTADLFCGLGAFTFAMARRASVTAAENDRTLLAALQAGARRAQGLKPIATLARDLMREPLSPAELGAFDAVLFDPPRAGAIAQAQALAKSRVGKIVAVSCNPASFARDAAALTGGGFRLQRVVPIDQFVFSPHLELVAVFSRK